MNLLKSICLARVRSSESRDAFDVEKYKGAYYAEAGYAIERDLDASSSITVDGSIAFWSRFIDKYTEGTPVTSPAASLGR